VTTGRRRRDESGDGEGSRRHPALIVLALGRDPLPAAVTEAVVGWEAAGVCLAAVTLTPRPKLTPTAHQVTLQTQAHSHGASGHPAGSPGGARGGRSLRHRRTPVDGAEGVETVATGSGALGRHGALPGVTRRASPASRRRRGAGGGPSVGAAWVGACAPPGPRQGLPLRVIRQPRTKPHLPTQDGRTSLTS
jgi:hypothetical protein